MCQWYLIVVSLLSGPTVQGFQSRGGRGPPHRGGRHHASPSSDGGDGPAPNNTPPLSFPRNAWNIYNEALESAPLATKSVTSALGFTIGDVLAQNFINREETYDWIRTIRLAGFGALIHGPTGHWFYGVLDNKIPGRGAVEVASKVAIDQLLWNPIFGIMFFTWQGVFERDDYNAILRRIQRDLMKQVTGSWKVWPLAHAISFRFIPPSQRLLYINLVQLGYNMFLSVIANPTVSVCKEH